MKTLNYSVTISAPKEAVWDAITDLEKYRQWAKGFSAESSFVGTWTQGSSIKFIDPNLGGTKAILEEIVPGERIHARHVAILDRAGEEQDADEMGQKWIGTLETYVLRDTEGAIELAIEIVTHEAFENMFEDSWPKSLQLLKAVAESG